jgi:hypothetical protein
MGDHKGVRWGILRSEVVEPDAAVNWQFRSGSPSLQGIGLFFDPLVQNKQPNGMKIHHRGLTQGRVWFGWASAETWHRRMAFLAILLTEWHWIAGESRLECPSSRAPTGPGPARPPHLERDVVRLHVRLLAGSAPVSGCSAHPSCRCVGNSSQHI